WCMMGGENNGSLIIYRNIIYPNVKKYSSQIDEVLEQTKDTLGGIASDGFSAASEAATGILTNVMQSAVKGEQVDASTLLAAATTQAAELKDKVANYVSENVE
ncbi:hypothetical protein, partial [Salmonella sp. s51228]|uniref:hypothetical protein n=1 Tax=Salmonella sp. s51228 TaxID=3159652 RepID=UPI0039812EB7